MENIVITPFPNDPVSTDLANKVFDNISQVEGIVKKRSTKKGSTLVMINNYVNDEYRYNFTLQFKKNNKIYHAVFPNPILLYLDCAISNYNYSEEIAKINFFENSKAIDSPNHFFLDNQVDQTNKDYTAFLQARIQSIIMLACTIEAFLNSMVDDNFIYIDDKGKHFNKGQIICFPIKDKYKYVIPRIFNFISDSKYILLCNKIRELEKIRNSFVHLSDYNTDKPLESLHFETFKEMTNINIEKLINSVKDYMALINDKITAMNNSL